MISDGGGNTDIHNLTQLNYPCLARAQKRGLLQSLDPLRKSCCEESRVISVITPFAPENVTPSKLTIELSPITNSGVLSLALFVRATPN